MTLQAAPSGHLSLPAPDEYDPYYQRYVANVPDGRVLDRLATQQSEVAALFDSLSEEAALHRYAPGKWSVKEVLGHLTDTERMFAHRALRFARADQTPLPGFDENAYVPAASFDRRTVSSLLGEWSVVRSGTLALFDGLEPAAWARRGTANGVPVSVRALAYITVGHADHHLRVLRERYGLGVS